MCPWLWCDSREVAEKAAAGQTWNDDGFWGEIARGRRLMWPLWKVTDDDPLTDTGSDCLNIKGVKELTLRARREDLVDNLPQSV